MDSYKQDIKLSFSADDKSLKDVSQQIESSVSGVDINIKLNEASAKEIQSKLKTLYSFDISDELKKNISDEYEKMSNKESRISELEKFIDQISGLKVEGITDVLEKATAELRSLTGESDKGEGEGIGGKLKKGMSSIGSSFGKAASNVFGTSLTSVFTTFLNNISKVFTSAWSELSKVVDYSNLTNEDVRDLKLSYGFDSAQAYGYSTAMEMLGFENMTDLMYADTEQLEIFTELYEKYSEKYNELYDSGYFDAMLEFDVEWSEFQTDLKLAVMDFFVDNKDTIIAVMDAIIWIADVGLTILTGVLSIITAIADFLMVDTTSDEERSANATAILEAGTSSQTITVNNTYNAAAQQSVTQFTNSGEASLASVLAIFE